MQTATATKSHECLVRNWAQSWRFYDKNGFSRDKTSFDGSENDRKNQAFQLEEEQIRDSSRLDTRREAVTRGKG